MYRTYQAHAFKTRLKIPLLYGVDAVHGHSNVIGAVMFPHNVGLGATRDAKLVEKIGRITARRGPRHRHQLGVRAVRHRAARRALGTRLRRLQRGPGARRRARRGRSPRAAGHRTERARCSVLACAKHYRRRRRHHLRDGHSECDAAGRPLPHDQGDTQLSEADLRRIHMPGYITAIRAGVGDHHAVLQQLERREDVGQQAPADRHPEEGTRLRGLPHLRLQRARRSCPATSRRRSRSRSTPAWTW